MRSRHGRQWLNTLPGLLLGLVTLAVAACGPGPGSAQRAADPEAVPRFMHVHGLEIPSWAPDVVYLSTHQGLIRIEAEGSWRFVSREAHDFMGFRVHPTEPGVLYSSGHPAPGSGLPNPLGFMVSHDGGVTWTPTSLEGAADFHALAVFEADGDLVYGWNVVGEIGLYRSLDGGYTWDRRSHEPLASVGGALALAVNPADPDHVLAGTANGLWRSDDGGASFERVLRDGAVSAVRYFPGDAERALVYLVGPEPGLALIENGAATPSPLDFAVDQDDAVLHIAIHPQQQGVVYLGTMREHLFRTLDGGQSWEQIARAGVPSS